MLDYWRNEKRNLTLGLEPKDGEYYFHDGEYTIYPVSKEDLKNLRRSINFLVDGHNWDF